MLWFVSLIRLMKPVLNNGQAYELVSKPMKGPENWLRGHKDFLFVMVTQVNPYL